MKHVRPESLKKAIFLEQRDFDNIIFVLYGNEVRVEYSLEGIGFYTEYDVADLNQVYQKLAEYFDVNTITSIHMDDCDLIGVWIIYKED